MGVSLAEYLRYNAIEISGFYIGSHSNNTKANFIIYNDLQQFADQSDVIFLTVTDKAISKAWSGLEQTNINNKIICHCSGSLSSDIFINADKHNAYTCSVHPILPFENYNTAISQISKAYFTIEGHSIAINIIADLLNKCGNNYYIIDGGNKTKYHTAACFASNFVTAVCQKAVKLMCECGFDEDRAYDAIIPLISSNVSNIISKGIKASLTGPVERNDVDTIKNHINALNSSDKILYKGLTKILTDIAKEIHSDRDYTSMEELL